jgi:hypothetical protein
MVLPSRIVTPFPTMQVRSTVKGAVETRSPRTAPNSAFCTFPSMEKRDGLSEVLA